VNHSENLKVREECNFMDLLVIESFKVSLPKYYNHIRSNKDIYLHNFLDKQDHYSPSRKATLNQINPFVRNLSTPVQNAVQALTRRLFPHFICSEPSDAKLFGSEVLLIQKKICSPDYFDRYFAFSIQDDDFPDSLFHKFYLQSQNHSEETLISQILDDFKKYSIENVAFKIVTHRSAIHEESAKKMIVAICRISDRFSQPKGFDFGTPFSFLALSVVTMIKSLDVKVSFQIAKKAIESSTSLFFAAELIARLVMPISRGQPKTISRACKVLN